VKGGDFIWPIKIVLMAGAPAKSNRGGASPGEGILIVVIIAPMLDPLCLVNVSADIPIASNIFTEMVVLSHHPGIISIPISRSKVRVSI
jgi:hypothetical protein